MRPSGRAMDIDRSWHLIYGLKTSELGAVGVEPWRSDPALMSGGLRSLATDVECVIGEGQGAGAFNPTCPLVQRGGVNWFGRDP